MAAKPIALIVDDDEEWLATLKDGLGSDYQVLKARSLADVNQVIDNNELKIDIALVDIRLNEAKPNDDSGLTVMFGLNKIGIPCIATTSNDNGDAVRAALMIGRAKDVWFKSERLVILKEKVENIGNRVKEERKEAMNTIDFNTEFWNLAKSLIFVAAIIVAVMVGVALLLPANFPAVAATAIVLIVIIFTLLALFYNKITGEQFTELIKSILSKKE